VPTRFTENDLKTISALISQPRLGRYLAAEGGDLRRALALYRWNAQVSAAFMFPLHMCEVSTRNGIIDAVERVYGPNWHLAPAFENSLPHFSGRPGGPQPFSPQGELRRARRDMATAGKVVAELRFAFWIAMLTHRHDGRLWIPWIKTEFPEFGPLSPKFCRSTLHTEMEEIRKFRNRIAHHEPIFGRNLQQDYDRMRQVIAWRSQAAADWIHREQGVTILLASRP
jgi:hypothetical protein